MNRIAVTVPTLLAAGVVLAGCVSQPTADPVKKSGNGGKVTIELHDDGCHPKPETVNAGVVEFAVRNVDADHVTEAELLSRGRMLGEQENLSPGLSGSFSLHLNAGKYRIWCPGAAQENWTFTVTGQSRESWKDNPALVQATQDYAAWVRDQAGKLVTATQQFADAINAGDLAAAKRLYPAARVSYERVEPVAETFGSLDPEIDARINDVATPQDFTGYHKLEQLMFAQHTLAGAKPVAEELVHNVTKLQGLVDKATYQPAQIANGATELINEIQTSKVTGEEERYSHTDLVDFRANLDGAMKAFAVLKPALQRSDPDLVTVITDRAAAVRQELAKYESKPGYLGSGYVNYTSVSKQQRTELSQRVSALGDALSQIAGKVA